MTRCVSYLLVLVLGFPVEGSSQDNPEYISIGLLLPDKSHLHLSGTAALAIEQANQAGGYAGREFKLLVRTAEGFWGAGSKESVSLVYEDQVRAIIGSLDGRNGHLAEQVATKSHLSYIECYATEPTLSQAFVPWFMRVVPNDNQQSELLAEQIRRNGGNKVAILSDGSYDCRYAVKSLTKSLALQAGISPQVISLDTSAIDLSDIAEKISASKADHLVLPFYLPLMKELNGMLKNASQEIEIYGTLHFALGAEKENESWKHFDGMYLLGPLNIEPESAFRGGSHAAFLYDAVNLVIRAIHEVGTEREAITEAISGSTYENGASGSIAFDDMGNRKEAARLYQIRNEVPQQIK